MSQLVEQRVPDLGDFHDVEVIEVLVKAGDPVQPETPLITLETDKATMDVPATAAGVVHEVKLRKGDRVSKDSLIALLAAGGGDTVGSRRCKRCPDRGSPRGQSPAAAGLPQAPPTSPPRTSRHSFSSSARDRAATPLRSARPIPPAVTLVDRWRSSAASASMSAASRRRRCCMPRA